MAFESLSFGCFYKTASKRIMLNRLFVTNNSNRYKVIDRWIARKEAGEGGESQRGEDQNGYTAVTIWSIIPNRYSYTYTKNEKLADGFFRISD